MSFDFMLRTLSLSNADRSYDLGSSASSSTDTDDLGLTPTIAIHSKRSNPTSYRRPRFPPPPTPEFLTRIQKALESNRVITSLDLQGIDHDQGRKIALMMQALASNTLLTYLDLGKNELGGIGAIVMARALITNTALTTLKFCSNDILDTGAVFFAEALKVNSTLTSLDLSYNRLRLITGHGDAMRLINSLGLNSGLQTLELRGNEIDDEVASEFVEVLKLNSTLTKLDLCQNNISDRGMKHITSGLVGNSSLLELDMKHNHFSEVGVEDLAVALRTNTTLTSIDLSSSRVGDAGCKSIAESLMSSSCFSALRLNSSRIDDEGGCALANALMHNSTLTSLDLRNNRIQDATAHKLADALMINSTLTSLKIFYSIYRAIGPAGVMAITNALETNGSITEMDESTAGHDARVRIGGILRRNTHNTAMKSASLFCLLLPSLHESNE